MLAMILAMAAATQSSVDLPAFDTAMLNAVHFCTQATAGGRIDMAYPSETFPDLPPDIAARSRLATRAQVPALIQRFAETNPAADFGRAEFFATKSRTGPVWISHVPAVPLCDIAITGQSLVPSVGSAMLSALEKDGWTLRRSNEGTPGAPLEIHVLTKPAGKDEILQLRVQRLLVGSNPDGIQMDIQIARGRSKAAGA